MRRGKDASLKALISAMAEAESKSYYEEQEKPSGGGGIQTSWKDSGGPWQCGKRRKYVKRSDCKKHQRIIRRI